jgi:creatinine amidohydrolase
MVGSVRAIAELDSRTLEREARRLVIIPVGALEAHGPHLPLGSDLLQAEKTARDLAERRNGLVAPGIPYGVCPGASRFPGTISLSQSTLSSLIYEVAEGFWRAGSRDFLVLSGHGGAGHMAALREGMEHLASLHKDVRAAVLCDYEFVYELRGKEAPLSDGHAGLLETSRVMAMEPTQVGPERPNIEYKVKRFTIGDPSPEDWPESVMGDTREASADLGELIQAHVMNRVLRTIDEIFPKKGP